MNARFLWLILGLATFVPMTTLASERIPVASDARATYTVLEVLAVGSGIARITTKRESLSGTSYSQREVRCKTREFRYIGDGDTLAEMRASKPVSKFGVLVNGSISEVISSFACKTVGLQ